MVMQLSLIVEVAVTPLYVVFFYFLFWILTDINCISIYRFTFYWIVFHYLVISTWGSYLLFYFSFQYLSVWINFSVFICCKQFDQVPFFIIRKGENSSGQLPHVLSYIFCFDFVYWSFYHIAHSWWIFFSSINLINLLGFLKI